jgi:predicted NAD/FAD-dependent oxidoreductase
LATPAPEAARLAGAVLSSSERDILADVQYEPAIALEVALGDPLVPRFVRIRVPRTEGWPIASLAIEPGRPGGRVPDGCAVARIVARSDWSRAHLAAPDDVLEKELLRWLVRLQPAAVERVRFARVSRWALALPRFEVGRYHALARWERVQRDQAAAGRRVYFAGDWLVGPSAEGAVTSGRRAAAAVGAALGL